MKAVALPFTKRKLREVARELYMEHGRTMPKGLASTQERQELFERRRLETVGRQREERNALNMGQE